MHKKVSKLRMERVGGRGGCCKVSLVEKFIIAAMKLDFIQLGVIASARN